jgi:hypothetical protein
MPRNRIIYNVQDLFFGIPSGEVSEVIGYHVLKRIDGVQSFNYDFNVTRVEVGALGKSQNISRQVVEPASIGLDFSYYLNRVTNEKRIGLNVAHAESTEEKLLFQNLFDETRAFDKRNVYLATNTSDLDIHKQNLDYIASVSGFLAGSPLIIEDLNAQNYGILAFQNCYISNYSVDISLGSLPKANVSLIADNAVFYSSGSGVHVPFLDTKSGTVYSNGTKILVPKHFSNFSQDLTSFITAFRPGDITVSIQKNQTEINKPISFETEQVQNFGMEISLDRDNISYFGHKMYVDHPLVLPVKANVNIGFLVNQTLTGSFLSNINRDDFYNIIVTCKRIDGSIGLQYNISGAKFDSTSYNTAIGENNSSEMSFTVDLDFDNKNKGIFVSGQVKTITGRLIDDFGNEITGDEDSIYYEYYPFF